MLSHLGPLVAFTWAPAVLLFVLAAPALLFRCAADNNTPVRHLAEDQVADFAVDVI